MKRYYNNTTGEWYTEGTPITRGLEDGIFSGFPTEELLFSWGFEEYVAPAPTPEEQLEQAINSKLSQIDSYNNSQEVNSFTIGGNDMWLTVEERQQIATQISANEAMGRETMTKWYNGIEFTFPLSQWKQMLIALEVYAGDALNVTEAHKAAVKALTTIEEIEAFDITAGYPEKINFDELFNNNNE